MDVPEVHSLFGLECFYVDDIAFIWTHLGYVLIGNVIGISLVITL